MPQQGWTRVRAVVAAGASVAVLVVGASAGGPNASASYRAEAPIARAIEPSGVAASTINTPSVASPVSWCCPGSTGSGLTVTGQASVRGQGTQARDDAITHAVTDATDQAKTAATAAGLSLGKIVELQVSASGYPYPLAAGAEGTPGTAVCSPGGGCSQSGSGVACPATVPCVPPTIAPVPVETFATVTITWAIG